MILHIFPYEKFTYDYINRINDLFNPDDHLFWIYGEKEYDKIKDVNASNVIYERDISKLNANITLAKKIADSKKVIIHSLFMNTKKLLFLRIQQSKYPNKFFWNIWGADLYNEYWNRNNNYKNKIRECIKKVFIKKIRAVGYIRGDYDFLIKHYNTNAKYYIASYTYDFYVPEVKTIEIEDKTVNILLGNSATKECQYEKAIDMLAKYKDMPIKVKCILSYPKNNEEYRKSIILYGESVLGNKFEPIVDFMSFDEYTKLLASIDLAIFNHNRQQALGNIASLLYLGKKVYINPENACKSYFEDIGAEVYSIEDLTSKDIIKEEKNSSMKENNRKVIDYFFSDLQFKKRWEKIFNDKY